MKKNRKITLLILAVIAIMVFNSVTLYASTENKMWSVVTAARDKDYSQDPENAPVLHIKADYPVNSGAVFYLELSNSADWVYDESSTAPSFAQLFAANGNVYESIASTSRNDLTYTVRQISSAVIEITVNDTMNKDDYIGIPIIVKIDGVAEASVMVTDGETYGITSGSYVFANKGNVNEIKYSLSSNANVNDEGAVKGDVVLEATASPGNSDISLTLPTGFHFSNTKEIQVLGEGSFSSVTLDRLTLSSGERTLRLYLKGLSKSTAGGKITISGLTAEPLALKAEEGDIIMTFSGFGSSNEKFKFAEYSAPKKEDIPTVEEREEEPPTAPEPVRSPLTVSVTSGVKNITINGEVDTLNIEPFIDSNGRMMVPLRFIAKAYGISGDDINWDAVNKVVTINHSENGVQNIIVFKIGDSVFTINGEPVQMDTTAVISSDYTFLPVRYVAEALGLEVEFFPETKTATFLR